MTAHEGVECLSTEWPKSPLDVGKKEMYRGEKRAKDKVPERIGGTSGVWPHGVL